MNSLNVFFKKLNSGGLYIIEDVKFNLLKELQTLRTEASIFNFDQFYIIEKMKTKINKTSIATYFLIFVLFHIFFLYLYTLQIILFFGMLIQDRTLMKLLKLLNLRAYMILFLTQHTGGMFHTEGSISL